MGRLFDRIEQMRGESEKRHGEVMVSLVKLESRQDHQEDGMAEYQEAIATLHQCVNTIKLERAAEKGKLSGMIIAASLLGNMIVVILSRTGVLDFLFGR